MSKDKGKKNKKTGAEGSSLEIIAGPGDGSQKKSKKAKNKKGDRPSSLEGLAKLAEHPLVTDLLAVGALAAVAAIAENGKSDPSKLKSADAVKAAGKAAAAAIGARILKEVTSGDRKKDAKAS